MGVRNNLTFEPSPLPLPADGPEIAALAGHLRAGRCALFVGSGLSAPAGLPTWGTLLDRVVAVSTPWAVDPALFSIRIDMEDPATKALHEPPINAIRQAVGRERFMSLCRGVQRVTSGHFDLQVLYKALAVVFEDSIARAEFGKLAEQKRYAELAGQCRDRLGRERFHDFVCQALTVQHDLPTTHQDIVRAPFSCIVTTNFDTLIEDAYVRYGASGSPRAPTGAELEQQGTLLLDRGFFILKAHGDAARPDTMVFTADDYRRIIHANPAFQAILSAILLTHAVLFVGYSLSDTNFRLLLDNHLTIFNGNVPPRYAILGGVSGAECEILWKTAKVQVLPYPARQHGEVGRFLATLADETSVGAKIGVISTSADSGGLAHGTKIMAYSTLLINSDGDRLTVELVRRRQGRDPERQCIGGGLHPNTGAMGSWLRSADHAQERGRSPMSDIRQVGTRLAKVLPLQVTQALAQLRARDLVEIACSSAVTRIPWEWMHVAGQPLALRHAIVRRPVEITHEARGRRTVNQPLRALVFGDAGSGDGRGLMPLPFADIEARIIETMLRANSRHTRVTRLSRDAATHERALSELEQGDYDLLHFGGHAWFDSREAYFMLWDRIMLGSELAPLLGRRPPALMVLNTHFTAFVLAEEDAMVRELVASPACVAPPRPARGFAEAAMRCGVTSFVGTFGNIGDRSGAEFSVAFYAHLLAGSTVAEALRAARRRTARTTLDAGMFYTAFGYPDFRFVFSRRGVQSTKSIAASIARAKARSA